MSLYLKIFAPAAAAALMAFVAAFMPSLSFFAAVAAVGFALCVLAVVHYCVYQPLVTLGRGLTAMREKLEPALPQGEISTDLGAVQAAVEQLWRTLADLRAENEALHTRTAEAEHALRVMENTSGGHLAHIDELNRKMGIIARKAHDVSSVLSSRVRQLSQLVGEVALGVEEQRFSLDTTGDAMLRIRTSVEDVAHGAATASEQAQNSRRGAELGAHELSLAVDSITEVKTRTLALKDSMGSLSERAQSIGKVVGFINDVADQTNLLALNAAIEAARAGDAGRGFAVVADEVRNLAEKTMQATREVTEAVSKIQEKTTETMSEVDLAATLTVSGAGKASAAGEAMQAIVQSMEHAAAHLESIAEATSEQSRGSGQTNEALARIRTVSQQTSSHMESFTATLVDLTSRMEELEIIEYALASGDLQAAAAQDKLVQWSDKLSTGLPLIDEQHKMLVAYINDLHRAMRQGLDDAKLMEVLSALYNYTVSHFSTEEQFFTHSNYADTQSHINLHRAFTGRIAEFRDGLQHGSAQVSMELLQFLKDWLIKHIQGTDHQYVAEVKQSLARHKI